MGADHIRHQVPTEGLCVCQNGCRGFPLLRVYVQQEVRGNEQGIPVQADKDDGEEGEEG